MPSQTVRLSTLLRASIGAAFLGAHDRLVGNIPVSSAVLRHEMAEGVIDQAAGAAQNLYVRQRCDCANQGRYAMSVGTILLIILIIILLGGFSGIGGGPFYGTGYYGGGGLGLVIIIILILILLGRI
jgi:hypothetical protein